MPSFSSRTLIVPGPVAIDRLRSRSLLGLELGEGVLDGVLDELGEDDGERGGHLGGHLAELTGHFEADASGTRPPSPRPS